MVADSALHWSRGSGNGGWRDTFVRWPSANHRLSSRMRGFPLRLKFSLELEPVIQGKATA